MSSRDKELDKYYTKPETASFCKDILVSVFDVSTLSWVEPSAGDGSFLFDFVTEAYDLLPEHPKVVQSDWFDVTVGIRHGVIGNPPFGKRNSLSRNFIRHATNNPLCMCVAFVLPAVYNKHTLQKAFPKDWSLLSTTSLPDNSFTFEGNDYHIPSVFQVWVRGDIETNLRAIERKEFTNTHFEICSKENADLFVMGASCNTVKYPCDVTATNRGYYLKAKGLTVAELKVNIESVVWKGLSSAKGGVAWLTKTEFINQYEEKYYGVK